MNRIFARLVAFAIFQAFIIPASLAAGTNAAIPYKTLDDLCQFIASVNPAKLEARVFVSSTNKAVETSDIRLTIQSASMGTIPVQLGTNGQVLNFPHEKALHRENPSIIANQPKGTITLFISMRFPLPEELTFRYRRLGEG